MKLSKNYEILWEGVMLQSRIKEFRCDDLEVLQKIDRIAKKFHRMCEDSCNGTIQEEAYELKEERLRGKVVKLSLQFSFPCVVKFQHDPRGAEVKLSCDMKKGYINEKNQVSDYNFYYFYPFNSF